MESIEITSTCCWCGRTLIEHQPRQANDPALVRQMNDTVICHSCVKHLAVIVLNQNDERKRTMRLQATMENDFEKEIQRCYDAILAFGKIAETLKPLFQAIHKACQNWEICWQTYEEHGTPYGKTDKGMMCELARAKAAIEREIACVKEWNEGYHRPVRYMAGTALARARMRRHRLCPGHALRVQIRIA